MSKSEDARKKVSEAYARVLARPAPGGSRCTPTQKGTLVRVAGYTAEELAGLPEDAVVNSFGCGNPLAFSEVRPGEVVLDLGSGAGIDLLIAAKRVGPAGAVIGVDMTDEMLDKAREVIAASGLTNVELRKGLIEELPVETESVDWVISNCVINLSPEKERVFAEIARVLRPGGRMLVSDVVAEDLPEAVRESALLNHCCVGGAISEEAYAEGLRSAGLTDVEIRERIGYELDQLVALVRSDQGAFESGACCAEENAARVADLAAGCAGKVWSAKIFARKPTTGAADHEPG